MLVALALFALFATVFPLCKIAFDHGVEPLFFTGTALLVAGIVLLTYSIVSGKKIAFDKRFIMLIGLLALCNIYLTNVCERWGLQYLSATKTCFMYNLAPFFSAFFSSLFLSEKLTSRKVLGLLIGFIGFFPYLFETASSAATQAAYSSLLPLPELALATAALSTVLGWITMRVIVQNGYNSVLANGYSMIIGGIATLLTSYAIGESWHPLPIKNFGYTIPLIILVALISYIIAYNVYGWLLNWYTATFLTVAGLSSPLFAALFGWLLLNENISSRFFISMIIVGVGVTMFHREERGAS